MLWAEWVDSKGAGGVEPPEYVKQILEDINAFQSAPAGSDAFKAAGARMVENLTGNLLFIGTALTPDPIYRRNALKNFVEFLQMIFPSITGDTEDIVDVRADVF